MNAIETVLVIERKQVVAELKSLTNSKSSKQLESAIVLWTELSDPKAFTAILNSPNRDKAVLDACKQLRFSLNSNPIHLFAALNRFRAYHGYYQYLNTMTEMHQKYWTLMQEQCAGNSFAKT